MSDLNKKNINYGNLNRFYQDLKSHDISTLNDKIDNIEIPEYTAGTNISINDDNVISCTYSYSLPTATTNSLGGVKVGGNLDISNGILSVQNFNLTKEYSNYGVQMNTKKGFLINNGFLSGHYHQGAFIYGLDNTTPSGWTTLGIYSCTSSSKVITKVSGSLPASAGIYIREKNTWKIPVRVERIDGNDVYLSKEISYTDIANAEIEICQYWSAAEDFSVIFGSGCETRNEEEVTFGSYNISHKGSTSGETTKFSVGNGQHGGSTYGAERHNALEVMQNGDTYVYGIGNYDGVHIKSETGYESTKTLQGVVSEKANQVDFVIPVDMQTSTYDWSAINTFTTTGIYKGVARVDYMGTSIDLAAMHLSVSGGMGVVIQSVITYSYINGTNNIVMDSRQTTDGGSTWSAWVETGLPSINDDASVTTAIANKTTYSRSKIDSLISALDQRLTAIGG